MSESVPPVGTEDGGGAGMAVVGVGAGRVATAVGAIAGAGVGTSGPGLASNLDADGGSVGTVSAGRGGAGDAR
jgi:hypothetical protein